MSPHEELVVKMLRQIVEVSKPIPNSDASPDAKQFGSLIIEVCEEAAILIEGLSDQLAAHTAMSERVSIN